MVFVATAITFISLLLMVAILVLCHKSRREADQWAADLRRSNQVAQTARAPRDEETATGSGGVTLQSKSPTPIVQAPTRPEVSSIMLSGPMPSRQDPILAYLAAPASGDGVLTPAVSQKAAALAIVSSLEFKFADITVHRRLGAGSFGQVYLATLHETPVALKVLMDTKAITAQSSGPKELSGVSSSSAVASASPNALLDEATLMASLRHPNVVNFLGYCLSPPCIVTEYCTRGSVYDLISSAKADNAGSIAGDLTWRRILDMAIGSATGMLHLHTRSPPVIHRDLKSPNLLVAADWTVKVADFNLSKLIDDAVRSSRASTAIGANNPLAGA